MRALRRKRVPGLWTELDPIWHLAFELAWEAYRAGSVPVGAVVTEADGTVVAKGRNRIYDLTVPEGRLAGTRLAHAEVDALAGLGPERRHEERVVWTTVEPCLLCVGATAVSTVRKLRYASADPHAGAAHAAPDQLVMEGPLPGVAGQIGALLHVEPYMRNNPDGAVVAAYRRAAPDVLAAAGDIVARGIFPAGAAQRVRFESLVPDLLEALPE